MASILVYPGSGEQSSESPYSDNAWTTPEYITADDGNTANITPANYDTNDISWVLKAYNFDLSSIPSGATIDGVIARVNCWYADGTNSMVLAQLLDISRAKVGTNQASTPIPLSTPDTSIITLGGSDDLWGNSLTEAWVKDADFGVALAFQATGDNSDVFVDYVRLEVFYTESTTHNLTAQDVTSGAPVIDQPTIGQTHILSAQDVTTGSPVIDQPTIGQTHILSSQDIETGSPVVDQPTLEEIHTLTAQDVTTGSPVIDQPTIGQTHILTSQDIETGSPVIDQPTIGQTHILSSQDVSAGSPVIDQPTLTSGAASAAAIVINPLVKNGGWNLNRPPDVPYRLNKESNLAVGLRFWLDFNRPFTTTSSPGYTRALVGKEIDLQVFNTIAQPLDPKKGKVALFDDSSSELIRGILPNDLQVGDHARTLACWFWSDEAPASNDQGMISMAAADDEGAASYLYMYSNVLGFYERQSAFNWEQATWNMQGYYEGHWNLAVGVREASGYKRLYFNGYQVATSNLGWIPGTMTRLGVGGRWAATVSDTWSGWLWNPMIWNRALTPDEVLSLYKNPWELYQPTAPPRFWSIPEAPPPQAPQAETKINPLVKNGGWNLKRPPDVPYRLNYDNPIVEGLYLFIPYIKNRSLIDFVKGRIPVTDPPMTWDIDGHLGEVRRVFDQYGWDAYDILINPTADDYTLMYLGKSRTGDNSGSIALECTTGESTIEYVQSGYSRAAGYTIGDLWYTEGISYGNSWGDICTLVNKPTNQPKYYQNARGPAPIGNSKGWPVADPFDTLRVGYYGSGGAPNFNYSWVAIWKRALSETEIEMFIAQPWLLYQPTAPPRFWSIPGAAPPDQDDLTAQNIETGYPVIDQATIGQTHVLTSQDVETGSPVIDQATIGQTHVLTSQDVETGNPTIDQPTIGQTHILTSQDVETGSPTIDQPTIGQTHVLTSQDVETGSPVIDQATIGQTHILTSQDVETGSPTIDQPTLSETPGLEAQDIVTGNPVIDQATIGQTHVLTSQDVETGSPVIDQSTIGQTHILTSQDVETGSPVIDQPILAETPPLEAQDIITGNPTIDQATIGQTHVLTAQDVETGSPVVDQSTIGQTHILTSQDIETGAPVIDQPSLAETPALEAQDVVTGNPVIDQPSLGQTHILNSVDVIAGDPDLESPTIGQTHILNSADVETGAPIIDQPTLTETHALVSQNVETGSPTIDQPAITQTHILSAMGVVTDTPVIDMPVFGQIHILTGQDVVTDLPTIGMPILALELPVTPIDRILFVYFEDRVVYVEPEDRTIDIEYENRTVRGDDENF